MLDGLSLYIYMCVCVCVCIHTHNINLDMICKIFPPIIFLMVSFETWKFVILMKSNLTTFSFVSCALGVIYKKQLKSRYFKMVREKMILKLT